MILRDSTRRYRHRNLPRGIAPFAALARVILILGLVFAWTALPASADDATPVDPTVEPTLVATVAPTAPVAIEEPTALPTIEATQLPLPETVTVAAPTEQATEAPALAQTPAVEATSPATLGYAPAQAPVCKTANDASEQVASGGGLDYDCTFDVDVSMSDGVTGAFALDWTISAPQTGGWIVQFQPPATEADPDPAWTPVDAAPLPLTVPVQISVTSDMAGAAVRERLTFAVRLSRPVCAVVLTPVVLTGDVLVTVSSADGVRIDRTEPAPLAEPYQLSPTLLPIPEPALAMSGDLNFGAVFIDANGAQQPPEARTLSVTVSGLDHACGAWTLTLTSSALDSGNGATPVASGDAETPATAGLVLVAVDGTAIEGGCALAHGCAVATITPGSGKEGTATYALSISLDLPAGVEAATLNATLTAALVANTP